MVGNKYYLRKEKSKVVGGSGHCPFTIWKRQVSKGVKLRECVYEKRIDLQFCNYRCLNGESAGKVLQLQKFETFRVRRRLAETYNGTVYHCQEQISRQDAFERAMEGSTPWNHFATFNHLEQRNYLRTMAMFSTFAYRTLSVRIKDDWKNGFLTQYPFILPSDMRVVALLQSQTSDSLIHRQGFVAIGEGRKMVIALRGTETKGEWDDNKEIEKVPITHVRECKGAQWGEMQVHGGFNRLFDRMRIAFGEKSLGEERLFLVFWGLVLVKY
jgi:hypothetical protein